MWMWMKPTHVPVLHCAQTEALSASCRLTFPLRAELRFLSCKWKFSNFAINFLRSLYPHRPITHKTAEHLWLILIAWLLLSSLKIIWRALNATACILGSANCIFGLTRNVIYYWFRTNVHVLSLGGTTSVFFLELELELELSDTGCIKFCNTFLMLLLSKDRCQLCTFFKLTF